MIPRIPTSVNDQGRCANQPRSNLRQVNFTSGIYDRTAATSSSLPRIHNLQSSRNEIRKKRHRVSDRDRKKIIAAEKALVQSFRQIGLLQANTLSNIEVKKNHPLLETVASAS
jgi:hypothetical protein